MPSTMSTSVSSDLFSSTVMTPSLPTFCIACAIILPIAASPLAEMVPICATSDEEATGLARFSRSLTTAATAISMPRLRSIGFMPADTDLAPSRTIACASTVAVVVPSPAVSLVLDATSRSIWAPMFSNLSSSSISLATVTPSLVMRGAPKLFSMRTLRPLGPSVTLTALARMSMPRNMRSRASPLNLSSLAAMIGSSWLCGFLLRGGPIEHAHDVGFLHDHQVFAVELDLGARPLREQHAIAALDVERMQLAALVAGAGTDGEHFAFHRLFLLRVGDKNAAGGLRLRIDAADQNAVLQWTQFHLMVSSDQICRNRFGTVKSRVPARHSGHGSEAGKYNGNQSIYLV